MDCKKAQEKLRAARRAKRAGEAWEISNTMRAHGCAVSLDGLKRPKRTRKACAWVVTYWPGHGKAYEKKFRTRSAMDSFIRRKRLREYAGVETRRVCRGR